LAAAAAATGREITIALVAPLNGPQAAEGEALKRAAERAVATINAQGGVNGRTVVLFSEDDGCDDSRAAAVAATVADRQPAVVVGHPCGAAAVAASRVYAAKGVLFIAAAPRHPDVTRKRAGSSVFRIGGRDDLQGAATAGYLAQSYKGRRLAIVHDRTRYARTLVDAMRRVLGDSLGAAVPEFGVVAASKDFAATVAGITSHGADVVYFAGFPSEAVAIWTQLTAAGLSPDIVGSDALARSAAELQAVAAARPGAVRVVVPFFPADTDGVRALTAELGNMPPSALTGSVAVHAAIEAWAAAVREIGTAQASAVAGRLAARPLETIIGGLAFDAGGDARLPSFAVAIYDNGRLSKEPLPTASGAPATRAQLGRVARATSAGSDAAAATADTLQVLQDAAAPPSVQAPAAKLPALPLRNPLRRRSPLAKSGAAAGGP
jgi:branched-chain amino acid transport system substrate-binding protein